MERVRNLIEDGAIIRWVGHSSGTVICHLMLGAVKHEVHILESALLDGVKSEVVTKLEAEAPGTEVGIWPTSRGWQDMCRIACISGFGLGGSGAARMGAPFSQFPCCYASYDIEVDTGGKESTGFPLADSRILSAALVCSCGLEAVFSTCSRFEGDTSVQAADSTDLTDRLISLIESHGPMWLIGYNCYAFDNCCLCYSASGPNKDKFRRVTTGSHVGPQNAFYLDLKGIYNVDMYLYLDKTMRHRYDNLSLGTVAKSHGLEDKLDVDYLNLESNLPLLLEYNLDDCRKTQSLWVRTGCNVQIPSLSAASSCPVVDCVRFVSGSMASCAMSSFAMSTGAMMDWSYVEPVGTYRGGLVIEPNLGLHRNVCLADYASMYPTIMMDMCISQENVCMTQLTNSEHDGAVVWDEDQSGVVVGDKLMTFKKANPTVPRACRTLMKERGKVGKRSPHGNSLKVLANSIYGALGYENSPMYSPGCAASVTLSGRWCLTVAASILTRLGLQVVYGDTDSCFVSCHDSHRMGLEATHNKVRTAINILHMILSHTPFKRMRMEAPLSDAMSAVLLLRKKNYCYTDMHGKLTSKGMSGSRKDRLGICRLLSPMVLTEAMMDTSARLRMRVIGTLIGRSLDVALSEDAPIELVCREVRSQGQRCLMTKLACGDTFTTACEGAPKRLPSRVSAEYICTSVKHEFDRLLRLAGLGGISSVIEAGNDIERFLGL